MRSQLLSLTDDYASNGPSHLNVSSLFCKHALSPLKKSDVALDILGICDRRAATVRFGYSHKTSYLMTGEIIDFNKKKKINWAFTKGSCLRAGLEKLLYPSGAFGQVCAKLCRAGSQNNSTKEGMGDNLNGSGRQLLFLLLAG